MFEIKKSETEVIRVEKSEFKGKEYVQVRTWYLDQKTDEWKPTQKGISVPIEKYEALREAINSLETDE